MTESIVSQTMPAYVQTTDGNRNYNNHRSHGLTEKDLTVLETNDIKESLADAIVAITLQGQQGQLATEKTAAAIQLANSLAFANTQNLLISGFKDGRYDAAVNAAATALAAATNASEIKAQLAACCCEMKEKIDSKIDDVEELINSVQATNNAVALANATAEILALKVKLGATP